MKKPRSLRAAVARAYKSTDLYTLDQLLAEERRWKRKATIAANKLASVRSRIQALATALAREKVGLDTHLNQNPKSNP